MQPGGLQNYNVPPPTMIDPSDNLANSSQPEQSLQDDDIEEDDNSLEEMEVDEGDGDRNSFDIISLLTVNKIICIFSLMLNIITFQKKFLFCLTQPANVS